MQIKDQLHRGLQFSTTPKRIISLVPSQTELIVDLGLQESLVGVTKFCVHPKNLRKEVTVVGGTKKVNVEKILELRPDLIICNKEENTLEMVDELITISKVYVSDIDTISDCFVMIKDLGRIFGINEAADRMVTDIKRGLNNFERLIKDRSSRKVIYLIWKEPLMAAGRKTFINSLLKVNKFENGIEDPNSRYPEVNDDLLKSVDLILLSSEPYPFSQKDVFNFRKKYGKKVKLVDGEYFSWYGSRLRLAFNYFKSLHT